MKLFYLVGALTIVAILAALTSPEAKETQPKYAWIDMQRAITNVKAGKSAVRKLKKEAEKNEKAFIKAQTELQKLQKEYEKSSLVWNEKKKQNKQLELQKRYLELQQRGAKYQQDLNVKQAKATQRLAEKVAQVVEDYAKKNGYSYVFLSNVLVHKPKGDDITDTIIALFDKKNKK